MKLFRLSSIFAQTVTLVFICVVATLGFGFGVLAVSPAPPPPTVSIKVYVDAYQGKAVKSVEIDRADVPPSFWTSPKGQAEALISRSLAGGLRKSPDSVRVAITMPSVFGPVPRTEPRERGQLTIIDVPTPFKPQTKGRPFDLAGFLREGDVRLPPFVAVIRETNGQFTILKPTEPFPSAWQLRLLMIFGLSLAVVGPLAWMGAQQWTGSIRRLASRVNAFDGKSSGMSVTRAGDAQELHDLEKAFEALQDRVKAQIEERMRMLTAVAHDLRTPLTSIRIRSEDVDEPLRSGFIRDVGRLEHMVNGVIAYSRAQMAHPHDELVDLARLVNEVVTDARMRGQFIEVHTEPALVRGSAVDLARVIENLLSNAARYATACRILLSADASDAKLSVSDNGPGVPERLIPRLTEPFFRVDSSRNTTTGGTGLGLATVKAIVDAHKGALEITNQSDGLTVSVLIQVATKPTS